MGYVAASQPPSVSRWRSLEFFQVTAEGIAIRTLPDERSPRTGEILREGEKFTAVEAVDGIDNDPRLCLGCLAKPL